MAAPTSPALLLRADAGPKVGSGHASRLLALARAWTASGGRAVLLTTNPSTALKARAAEAGADIVPLPASHPDEADLSTVLTAIKDEGGAPWIAVDGYSYDAAYLNALRAAGARVLAVDDTARLADYPADAFLNQNPGAEAREHPLRPETLPLLGPRWSLLRPGFAEAGARRSFPAQAARVLISFGGADSGNAAAAVLRALHRLKLPFEAVALVGSDNPHAEELQRASAGLPVRLERDADVPARMAWADVAVIGGGVTMLEACAAGLPALVATLADNQEPGAAALAARGAMRPLGKASDFSEAILAEKIAALLGDRAAREALSKAGRAVADGSGAARVVAALRALSAAKLSNRDVRLRPAGPDDAVEIWRIANEPSVRAHSFRKEPIPLAAHLNWYRALLADGAQRFWLMEAGGVVAGQIRYAKAGDEAEVHYSVRAAFRGKGLGTLALALSKPLACAELGARALKGAVIKPNEPSERSFLSAGWSRRGEETRDGRACAVFEAACS